MCIFCRNLLKQGHFSKSICCLDRKHSFPVYVLGGPSIWCKLCQRDTLHFYQKNRIQCCNH